MGFSDHMKVLLGVDTKGFNTGLSKAEKRASGFGKVMKSKVLPLLGAAAFARTAKSVMAFGANVGDLSKRLGVNAEFLQKFQFAAEQSGVKSEAASIALQRFARRTAEARTTGGALKDELDKLGISLTDSGGAARSTEEVFEEFGQKISQIKDPSEKLRVAFKFLDTEGVALTQMFQEGGKTLQEYGKEAESLGLVMSNSTIKSLQDADATLLQTGRQMKVMLASALQPLTKHLQTATNIIGGVINVARQFSGVLKAGAAAAITYVVAVKSIQVATKAAAAIQVLMVAVSGLTRAFGFLRIAAIAVAMGNFTRAAKVAAVAMRAFSLAVAANPVGLLVAAVAALATGLVLLNRTTDQTVNKLKELEQKKLARLKTEMQDLQTASNNTKLEIIKLKQELLGLQNMGEIKIPIGEQLKLANQEVDALNAKLKTLRENEKAFLQVNLALQEHKLQLQQQEGAKDVEIAQTKRNIEALNANIAKIEKQELEIQIAQEKALQKQKALQQQIADAEAAREMGIADLLAGKNQETIELQRQVELLEAAKTGNQELVDRVKERHKFQDEVARLVKDENMGLQEAAALVEKRMKVDEQLEQAEQNIADAIEGQKQAKEGVNGEAVQAINLAKQEKAIHEQNQKIFNDQLRVLKLQAQGRDDEAAILQKKIENENEILQIMEDQGVNAVDAIDLLKKRLKLEKDITLEKLAQEEAEIRNNNLMRGDELNNMGASERAKELQKMTREERQRARDQMRADRLRDQLEKDNLAGKDKDKMQRMLDDLKDKLLTDDDKKKLEEIEKKKKEAEELQKKLKRDLEKQKKEAEKELKEKAAAEKKKLEEVLEAGEDAIKEAGKDIAGEIKRVKAPEIKTDGIEKAIDRLADKINLKHDKKLPEKTYPDSTQTGGVTLPSELRDLLEDVATETTLTEISTTLKGKFINQ